jgi:hypothetical protein
MGPEVKEVIPTARRRDEPSRRTRNSICTELRGGERGRKRGSLSKVLS